MKTRWEKLPGLPATGPITLSFRPDGRPFHSEGLVVRFFPVAGAPWTGNFYPAFGRLNAVFDHPNQRHIVVIAQGQAYVVEPELKIVEESFGADLCEAVAVLEPSALVLAGYTSLEVITPDERWCSPRVSWDGIWDLSVLGSIVSGTSFDAINEAAVAFSLDVATRELVGGAYSKEFG